MQTPHGSPLRSRLGRAIGALGVVATLAVGMAVATPPAAAEQATAASEVVYDGSVDGIDGSVYRLYRAFFLREPEADGLVYWIVQARYQGYPIGSIANDFARSDEFRRRYGSLADGPFVDLVYRNVLGRAPDPEGRAYWLDQMRRGMIRGHVMLYFSDSAEFARRVGAGPFGTRDYRGPARAAPSAPSSSYEFMQILDGGRPLGWARCRPVYVAANPAGIPADQHDEFLEMLDHALDRISDATGQHWVHVGETSFQAADEDSTNPVPGLVSVSFMSAPDPTDGASAWARNSGGRNPVTGSSTYLSGVVSLNAGRLVREFDGRVTPIVATTLMHELGHVAGLAHTDDESQLMAQTYHLDGDEPAFEEFRDGDRSGLAQVGSVTTAC